MTDDTSGLTSRKIYLDHCWEKLIELNSALLDEQLPHRRRALVLDAIFTLTGQRGGLWMLNDEDAAVKTLPDIVSRAAQTQHSATDTDSGQQAIPLFHRGNNGRLFGVIYGTFSVLPTVIVQALVSQTQLAHQLTTLDSRAGQLATIAEVSRAIASELNLEKLLKLVVKLLNQQLGYQYVHLFVVHKERDWIEFKEGVGLYADHLNRATELSFDLNDEGIIPWVARTGQSALINDVYQDTYFRPLFLPGIEIKSELVVPLIFGDEVQGVFDIESELLNAFSPDDQWLLETLAANIAIALRNASLYRSERWRRKSAEGLRRIAGVVRTKETLDNILQAILEQLAAALPLTFATIWLKTESGYQFRTGYQIKEIPSNAEISHSWFDEIIVAKSPLIRDSATDNAAPLAEKFPPGHSAVGAALTVDENVLGVLVLVHRKPNRFGHEACKLIEIFAGQAAIVIENTDLYHKARKQAWMSTALLQVAQATRNLQTLDEVLSAVTRISPMIAGVDACAIFLRHEADQIHYCAATYGLSDVEQVFLTGSTLSDSHLLTIRLAILKRPVIVSARENQEQLPGAFVPFFAEQTLLFLPLLSQGDLNGVMMMVIHAEQTPSDEQLQMLSGIAYQAASAIQTAQLIEAQQAEAYVSAALLQVAQTVAVQSDLSEVLDTVARITPMLTGASHCLVFLYNGEQTCTLEAAYGLKSPSLPLEIPLDSFSVLNDAIIIGLPQPLTAMAQLPDVLHAHFGQPQFQGVLLPLVVKNSVVGALLVAEDESRVMLPAKRRDILTGIAYQIALAIDNARLYAERVRQEQFQRELQLAKDIQESFIPSELPILDGWEFASYLKMAREVGGDFFDIIPMSNAQLMLIIADVADKGLPAALFMARTSSLVRAVALESDQPAEILSRVNRLLANDAQQGMFVTAFCAVLDLNTCQFRYASAGHNPPVYIRRSGELTTLRTAGIVLGVVDEFAFEQKSLYLDAGDGILFYTDGVTEAFNDDDELFGEARLLDTLRDNRRLPSAELVDKIHQTVFDFAYPRPQSDDFTLLFLRSKPKKS